MGAASMGVRAKIGIGAANPVDKPFEVLQCNVRKIPTIRDTGGIRGILSAIDERAREGNYTVSGQMVLPGPSPLELDSILPYVTGSAKVDGAFALADTPKASFFLAEDLLAKVPVFNGCKVNRATFQASQGNFLQLTLDIEGLGEVVGAAGTFPALVLDTGPPYQFFDCIFTVGGVAKEIIDLEVSIDNALAVDKFRNSMTRSALPEGERVVTCRTRTPFTADEVTLYTTAPVAVVATFTNGDFNLILSMPAVRFAAELPGIPDQGEITIGLTGRARKTGANLELLISNDTTVGP